MHNKSSESVQSVQLQIQNNSSEITVVTSNYQVSITREGFGIKVQRGDELVLESAQPGDSTTNLSFEQGGAIQHVTKLHSLKETNGGLTLEYETSYSGTRALVELLPQAHGVRFITRLLHIDEHLTPSLRYRLAPSGFWYGGGFQGWREPQILPLNDAHISKAAFFAKGATQGTPIWYATKGVAIWIRTPKDFRYTINKKINGMDDGLLSVEMPGASSLTYEIVIATDLREVIRYIVRQIGYPVTTPPSDYFRLPIYTTWIEHKTDVSQEKVLEFARSIKEHNLPCGVIEIDDKWEERYGDMRFAPAKFPNPKAMVEELHNMGYRVTLWVHPFVNTDSETFAAHRDDGLLVRDQSGNVGLIKWWNGVAAVWDFTNPKVTEEFRNRLTRLQTLFGFDGFKFDGGDVNLVPQDLRSAQNITPAEYADIYNREATAHFVWNETRVGIYSQPLGIVQRLIDKHSVWGKENGLAAIIPEALTVSLRGFQYVMPDMVGGNQYDQDKIDKELLIRWAQASALMPLLQFSWGPWHFDEETVRLCREASEVHIKFSDYIIKLAQEAPRTGEPIIAPLWYHWPQDPQTYAIADQFMLGNDVVVAPVIFKGAVSRDLYLPEGRWRDARERSARGNRITGELIEGKRWLRNYPAPLTTLPIFVREGSNALHLIHG